MKNLEIIWSISRGSETYGYNICTLWDFKTPYRTCGNGYDMIGAVFGEWLQTNYLPIIIEKLKPCIHGEAHTDHYGFFYVASTNTYYLDGACGFSSMQKIARDIGLEIQLVYNKQRLTNILIKE